MRIDAHQHFWPYDPARYGWIPPGSALAQDRMPGDVRPAMAAAAIDAGIAVQARHDVAETAWLLDLAAADPAIAGVVGWADLTRPDTIAPTRGLVGLRHIAQDESDDAWLARDDVVAGLRACAAAGLTYDLLVYAHQTVHLPRVIDRVAGGRFVLDHGGKPAIRARGWQPWADAVAEIARFPNVWCKLSGLVTEADHAAWAPDDIARYMDHLLACFGPERLIFGSDWPVCLLAADYARVHALAAGFVARACPDHADAVFGGNARAAYAL